MAIKRVYYKDGGKLKRKDVDGFSEDPAEDLKLFGVDALRKTVGINSGSVLAVAK